MNFFVRIVWAPFVRLFMFTRFYLQDTERIRQSTSKTESAFHKKVYYYLFPVSWIQPLPYSSFFRIYCIQLCWSFFNDHSEFEELEAVPTSAAIDGPLEPPLGSTAVVLDTPDEPLINYFSVYVQLSSVNYFNSFFFMLIEHSLFICIVYSMTIVASQLMYAHKFAALQTICCACV